MKEESGAKIFFLCVCMCIYLLGVFEKIDMLLKYFWSVNVNSKNKN